MKTEKKSYFAPAIDKHFAAWILMSTWWKGNLTEEIQFYRFVLSLHKNSKLVGKRAGECDVIRTDQGLFLKKGSRNPRTYDKKLIQSNIIEAVQRNHTFDDEYLHKLAE